MKLEVISIGIIRTPFTELEGMPIQPRAAKGVNGVVDVYEKYQSGLKDLEGFSHIILLYQFHKSDGFNLEVVPYLDDEPRGLFSTRAPKRPNPIGLSVVELDRIEGRHLYVRNVDMLDGTPLVDIKPYVPEFDSPTEVRIGWLEKSRHDIERRRSDDRFK